MRLTLNVSKRWNLRQRLLFLLLLASAPGMAVAVFLAANALADQARQIELSAKRLASIQAAQHGGVVESARIMLDTLVETQDLHAVGQGDCRAFLKDWLDRYLSFTSLTLLDAQGNVVCSNLDSELPFDPAQDSFFARVAAEKKFVVGDYAVGRGGVPLIVAASPVLSEEGAFAGAVAVGIDLRWLEFLARKMDLPADGTITALGPAGDVLTHYRAADLGQDIVPSAGGDTVPAAELRHEMAQLGEGVRRGLTQAGDQRVYGFQRADAGGLVLAVGMPRYLAFERYGAALRDTLMAPMAILVLALGVAAYASEALVTRWVRSLTRTATRMARGDLSARAKVPDKRYEMGTLAVAFNRMAEVIQRNQAELRRVLEQRHALLRELNHRAKNNMQLIASVLEMKARGLGDDGARGVLAEVVERIRALAEIHRLLYRVEDSDHQVPDDYTVQLGRSLERFYSSETCDFEAKLQPVRLPADTAVLVGLIFNELVANACKHAFPDGARGTVRASLEVHGGTVHLSVADTGVALPADFTLDGQHDTTGLRLVRALADQLGGEVSLDQVRGWKSFHLRFPLHPPEGPPGPAS